MFSKRGSLFRNSMPAIVHQNEALNEGKSVPASLRRSKRYSYLGPHLDPVLVRSSENLSINENGPGRPASAKSVSSISSVDSLSVSIKEELSADCDLPVTEFQIGNNTWFGIDEDNECDFKEMSSEDVKRKRTSLHFY